MVGPLILLFLWWNYKEINFDHFFHEDEEMEDMEDSKSDLDFKPPTTTNSKKNKSVKKSLRSSNNSTSLSNKRNGRDANTTYDPINSR